MEPDPSILQHQMTLCQSQIRFSATDHRDCHFREESLGKATVLTSKRLSRASGTSGNLEYLKNLENLRIPSRRARPAQACRKARI